MLKRLRDLPLLYSILIAMAIVLLVVEIPAVTSEIVESRRDIERRAEHRAESALKLLQALHTQSMLNRKETADGDPAIATLDGTMKEFSKESRDVRLWAFMSQTVIDFQTASGAKDIEPALDDIDAAVLQSGEPVSKLVGNVWRVSQPIVLGSGPAANPKCSGCHAKLMRIGEGELIGGYSAAIDLTEPLAHWRSGVARFIAWSTLLFAATLIAMYFLLRLVALKPLGRLAATTKTLASGNTDVTIDLEHRRDALGSMARSLAVFRDSLIAKQKLESDNAIVRSELRFLSRHDPLTGLPNRARFQARADEFLSAARGAGPQLAILCLDIDRFKDVNDMAGQEAGDVFLQVVAVRLQKTVGDGSLVARFGADEFAVMKSVERSEQVEALCRDILKDLDQPIDIAGRTLHASASVGAALAPMDGKTAEELIQSAQTALSLAKGEGRNSYRFFSPAMSAALQERREIEANLREAYKHGDLELHYQPQLDLASEKIVGVEALMRWRHPEQGWISPARFIPVAESTGLIVPIGRWLLRTACQQAAMWPGITLSVNLSAMQFRDPGLVDTIKDALAASGLKPCNLELEITESVLMHDEDNPLQILNELRAFGIGIVMDDFGTGYSSLGYLRSFPFQKIKIDRSFICSLEENESAKAIVKTIIDLGHHLHMTTTAEGVETQAEYDFVKVQGCDQVQGYYVAKPMEPLKLTVLLGQRMSLGRRRLREVTRSAG